MSQPVGIVRLENRQLRSVMVSPSPKSLCSYYNQHGLDFRKVQIGNGQCFFSYRKPIIILDSADFGDQKNLSCGLAVCEIYPDSSAIQENDRSQEIKSHFEIIENTSFIQAHFKLDQSLWDSLKLSEYSDKNEKWVHVLKSANIEKARDFYADLGIWKKEQHDQGPLHYSLVDNSNVFELYPLKNNSTEHLGYIILSQNPSSPRTDPEGRTLCFLKENGLS